MSDFSEQLAARGLAGLPFARREGDSEASYFRAFAAHQVVPHEIFRLRYEVYCVECAFLDPGEFDAGMEFDEFDSCATHFAAYDVNDALIGTVRLVQPSDGLSYPLLRHCSLFEGTVLPDPAHTAEISRLAVRKTHRRRSSDSLWGVPGFEHAVDLATPLPGHRIRRSDSPLLVLGLYREILQHSRVKGVRYLLAAMEKALVRSLRRLGFPFQAIGPQCDYYGAVTPYMLDLWEWREQLAASNPALAAWFHD